MLILEKEGHIIEITLNRPEVRNALDEELISKLIQTLTDLSVDESLQMLILKAKGSAKLYHFPAPTIAVVHSSAYGGGMGIAACCDIAIASEKA